MKTRLTACIGGMLLVLSSGLSAQSLVYEREYTLIGEADNTLRVELFPDDRMVVERPLFMTRAGRHEVQAPEGTYDRMRSAFEASRVDSLELHRDVQRRAAEEFRVVTDPEFSRFALVDGQRGPLETVTVVSLEAWAQVIEDERLDRLDAFERDWFALMDALVREDAR